MKFGIVTVFPPVENALANLRLAEEAGFDQLWVTDSHVIWNECYSLLGWLVGQSRSDGMRFGTMVTNPVTRDPIVIASAFATLNQITGGRVECGLGRGDSVVRVLNRRPGTVSATEAAANLIRALASGDATTVDGAEVRLDWVTPNRLPVYVAAYGPRMLEVAGRSGDGVIIECADPVFINWALDHFRRSALEAGRDPKRLSVVVSTATYVSQDKAAARNKVRALGALVGNHIAEVIRNVGPEAFPPEIKAIVERRVEYDYHQHVVSGASHANYVSDDVVDRLCIVGTADECAERLRGLEALGVTHVNFYGQVDDFEEQMRTYGRDILPAMRMSAAR
jgi:probable F420-dependent oxidoreductase